jgi:hypothetical protein
VSPRIWDTFLFCDELDLLECRLRELQDVPRLTHVLVESISTFQGRSKPLWYAEHKERFAPWAGRIVHVVIPPQYASDAWGRESAQREYARAGLQEAVAEDIILHGDVDEIPRASIVRVEPAGHVLGMGQHIFAVDWLDPRGDWPGTVALRASEVQGFAHMRSLRNALPRIPDAGWHLTWLGGPEAITAKVNAFSHTEIIPLVTRGNAEGLLYEKGRFWSSETELGIQLTPVDVDGSWPQWIRERECPRVWFRPREAQCA